jgi:hypothetical protein
LLTQLGTLRLVELQQQCLQFQLHRLSWPSDTYLSVLNEVYPLRGRRDSLGGVGKKEKSAQRAWNLCGEICVHLEQI